MKRDEPTNIREDDEQTDDEQDGAINHRPPFERWPENVKEQAFALWTSGQSVRAVAKAIGASESTVRHWQISNDEQAVQARKEQAAKLVQRSWEIAAEALEKTRNAPVRSIQEAAVSYGILVDKAMLIEARTAALTPNNGKQTVQDLMVMMEAENARRRQEYLASRPTITATIVQEE
jgi:hypothetical protein